MRFSEAAGLLFRHGGAPPAPPAAPPDPALPDPARPSALDAALPALAEKILGARGAMDDVPDAALLALLLGWVMQGRPVGDTAERAVAAFGSFAAVLAAGERELRAVPGLGTHSVAAIALLHNAAIRLARAGLGRRRLPDEAPLLAAYLQTVLAREPIEQFRILFLDESGALVADEAQARGTVNHTPVYPREVVRRAIELDCVSLILVHNHPSGDPTPSQDDLEMTRQIEAAASVLEIAVRDHVIVGNGRVLSFREEGLLGL